MNANVDADARRDAPATGVTPYEELLLQLGPIFRREMIPARIYPVEPQLRLELANRNRLPNMLELQRVRDAAEAERRRQFDHPDGGQ